MSAVKDTVRHKKEDIDVNDAGSATDSKQGGIDLSTLSDKALEALVPKIQQELAQRRGRQTKEALEKMQEIAKSVGITPEELLGS